MVVVDDGTHTSLVTLCPEAAKIALLRRAIDIIKAPDGCQ
jgi:hypothetical protein